MRDQLHGDDPRQLRAETVLGKHSQGPEILRVQLTSALTVNGNATCKALDFTGATWAMSTRQYTLYDSLNKVTGGVGDKLWAIWNVDSRRLEALGPVGGGIPIYNDAGEQIPAYSQVYPSGLNVTGSVGYVIKVKKPSTVVPRDFFVTGSDAIEDGQNGMAQAGPLFICKYDTGTPIRTEHWMPRSGQYTLSETTADDYYQNYNVLGILDAGNKLLLATQKPYKMFGGMTQSSTFNTASSTAVNEIVQVNNTDLQYKCGMTMDTGTYKITVEFDGVYNISAQFSVLIDSMGIDTLVTITGHLDASGKDLGYVQDHIRAVGRRHLHLSTNAKLAAGDEIGVYFQSSSSAAHVYNISNARLAVHQI